VHRYLARHRQNRHDHQCRINADRRLATAPFRIDRFSCAHLRALREQGSGAQLEMQLRVQASTTDDLADVRSCDYVLFCVKTFDTDAAAA
jgi:hypothetical protein